jgi:hypothetical protein
VFSICWNSFTTVGKAFQVKLVEGMLRVCKAVIKAKGGYFEEPLFWLLHDSTCYFIVLIPSLFFYNVENSTNIEKPLNE